MFTVNINENVDHKIIENFISCTAQPDCQLIQKLKKTKTV